ncbi:MAG: guanylate kinase [Propionibacteriaceae bacterium]|nr:guanylate kinase [Propionibacteriaceae bacterium]
MNFTPTVLVGPSGVGKGTVLSTLCAQYPQIWLSVSVTTRRPRRGEINGQHYYFVDDARFDQMIAGGDLLEWATYQSARYGTPRADVDEKIRQGRAVVMELDVQGARQVMSRMSHVRTVFLAPPSWEELERRLRGRGTESEQVVQRRLATARDEMEFMDQCDHVIVHHEVASAVAELVNLIGLGSVGPPDERMEKDTHP